MVVPNSINAEEIYARTLASFNQPANLTNGIASTTAETAAIIDVESYAKSLVEDDLPKIDSAVKGYLSLVAARSAVASDLDVISTSSSPAPVSTSSFNDVQCTFVPSAASSMDANQCALVCARTLLATINSTTIAGFAFDGESSGTIDHIDERKNNDNGEKVKIQLQNRVTQIVWNKLVQSSSSSSTGDKAKQTKPSKVLGRVSLRVAYPYVQERFRLGIFLKNDDGGIASSTPTTRATKSATSRNNNPLQSSFNELLTAVAPPKGIDTDQWKAFYTEFGNLLSSACRNEESPPQSALSMAKVEDDSALLWSNDRGSAELRQRRKMRTWRATQALA